VKGCGEKTPYQVCQEVIRKQGHVSQIIIAIKYEKKRGSEDTDRLKMSYQKTKKPF